MVFQIECLEASGSDLYLGSDDRYVHTHTHTHTHNTLLPLFIDLLHLFIDIFIKQKYTTEFS